MQITFLVITQRIAPLHIPSSRNPLKCYKLVIRSTSMRTTEQCLAIRRTTHGRKPYDHILQLTVAERWLN